MKINRPPSKLRNTVHIICHGIKYHILKFTLLIKLEPVFWLTGSCWLFPNAVRGEIEAESKPSIHRLGRFLSATRRSSFILKFSSILLKISHFLNLCLVFWNVCWCPWVKFYYAKKRCSRYQTGQHSREEVKCSAFQLTFRFVMT